MSLESKLNYFCIAPWWSTAFKASKSLMGFALLPPFPHPFYLFKLVNLYVKQGSTENIVHMRLDRDCGSCMLVAMLIGHLKTGKRQRAQGQNQQTNFAFTNSNILTMKCLGLIQLRYSYQSYLHLKRLKPLQTAFGQHWGTEGLHVLKNLLIKAFKCHRSPCVLFLLCTLQNYAQCLWQIQFFS